MARDRCRRHVRKHAPSQACTISDARSMYVRNRARSIGEDSSKKSSPRRCGTTGTTSLFRSITRFRCKLQRVLEPAWMMGTESSPNALPGDHHQLTGHFRASHAWGGNSSIGQNQPLSPLNANADVGEGTKNVFLAQRARETHGECLSLPRRPDGNKSARDTYPLLSMGKGSPTLPKRDENVA